MIAEWVRGGTGLVSEVWRVGDSRSSLWSWSWFRGYGHSHDLVRGRTQTYK